MKIKHEQNSLFCTFNTYKITRNIKNNRKLITMNNHSKFKTNKIESKLFKKKKQNANQRNMNIFQSFRNLKFLISKKSLNSKGVSSCKYRICFIQVQNFNGAAI